jgi:hypothetical protein
MKNMLRPLKIYDVDGNNLVTAELKAYASGIDTVKTQMNLLLREGFVQTAQDIGILKKEDLLGVPPQGVLNDRRDRILELLSRIRGAWDKLSVDEKVSGFSLEEDYESQSIRLVFSNPAELSQLSLSTAVKALRSVAPAHLSIKSNYAEKTWTQMDALNYTFIYKDMLDLSFENMGQQ